MKYDATNILETLLATNIPLDNHETDLYAKVTPESKAIIAEYEWKANVTTFRSEIDHELWYDIPFAFWPGRQGMSAKGFARR